MDILSLIIKKAKQLSDNTWVMILITVAASILIGLFFKYATHYVDHPIEQLAEGYLDDYGIHYDFSESKK